MSPKIIVKAKAAIFIIAVVVLVFNLLLMLTGIFSYLEFLLVLAAIFVGANVGYRLIDRKDEKS